MRNNKLFASLVFSGYCDGKIFGEYIRNFLLKELKQNDVVVMDNISFHKNKEIISIIEGTGAKILYTPPYCPDLNKIEHFWHKIKQIIQKTKHEFEIFFDYVCHFLNMSIA